MWWIWFSIFLLAVAWLGLAVAAYKLWLRINDRMAHNELQQAETDTFTAHQRDLLDEQRNNLQGLQSRYNSYVRQTDHELVVLEEYVDCVRDGLVNYGGFVRFNELNREQRTDMFNQEKSNRLLFHARRGSADTTDAAAGSSDAVAPASCSMEVEDPMPLHGYLMEEGEEERPVEGDVLQHVNPVSREGELIRIIRHLQAQVIEAMAYEHFNDAADVQATLEAVLTSAQNNPHLTLQLARQVTGCYYRLHRRARNRGDNAFPKPGGFAINILGVKHTLREGEMWKRSSQLSWI
eukprot:s4949_g5.t1